MKKLLALLCLGLLLFATGCPPAPTDDTGANGNETPIVTDDTDDNGEPIVEDDAADDGMDEESFDTADTPKEDTSEEAPPDEDDAKEH